VESNSAASLFYCAHKCNSEKLRRIVRSVTDDR
jgi:hypothetical protein